MSVADAHASTASAAATSADAHAAAASAAATSVGNLVSAHNQAVRVLAAEASVSVATLTVISGMSLSVDNAGIYEIHGQLMFQTSAGQLLGFGLKFPTLTRAAFKIETAVSVGQDNSQSTIMLGKAILNESGSNSIALSVSIQTAATYPLLIDGCFVVGAVSGAIEVVAKCSAGGVMLVRAGSFLRMWKIG